MSARVRGLRLVCPLAALLAVQWACDDQQDGRTRAHITFLFPVASVTQFHPFYIARERGYFREEGLDVEFQVAGGSSAAVQQLLAGHADAALPSPGAVLNAVARGNDLRWIFSYQYSNIFTLVVPEHSGVHAIGDLKGRKLGVSELSGGEVPLVRALLRNAGLREGVDVAIVPVGEGAALTVHALQTHQVDAYSSNLFDVAALKASGFPVRTILPRDVQRYPSNGIVTTPLILQRKREQLVSLARAVARAIAFARDNDAAAFEVAARLAPEEFEDPILSRQAWEAARALKTPPPSLANEPIGTHFRPGFAAYQDFLLQGREEEGALPRAVNLDSILDSSLLRDVNAWNTDDARRRATSR